ncbi:MAG: hypothetical protein HY518_05435 [Candidatus Aenigmarchaeota archaeon]|nr:hypothetical protein [Candidatus Aenigmarchaeota archaeon]
MHGHLGMAGLPPYAREMMSQVLDRTGYPLVLKVSEIKGPGYDAELRMARRGQSAHELAYTQASSPFVPHLLVSASRKILRMWEVPADERLVEIHEAGRLLPREDHEELRQKLPSFMSGELDQLSHFIYDGMTRQLVDAPVDIRVERELAESLPEHQEKQKHYLRQQLHNMGPYFDPQIAKVSPERLYGVSTAMNVVLAAECSALTGDSVPSFVRGSRFWSLAQCLRGHLDSNSHPGFLGDRKVIDLWAAELGLEGWYRRVRFDEL